MCCKRLTFLEKMASIYQLKTRFQALLRPLVGRLARAGVTANQVTLAALLLSFIAGGCMALWPSYSWPWLLLPAVMFVRMGLNAIDGMLAREHDMKSPLGAILNELGDVLSDIALYLPFALIDPAAAWLVAVLVPLAIITEMTGVIGVQIGVSRRYDGPMGKSDRAFVFGAAAFFYGLGLLPAAWMIWIFAVVTLLLVATIMRRAKGALTELSSHGR